MWYKFELFAIIALISWAIVIPFSLFKGVKFIRIIKEIATLTGILSISVFIIILWNRLERPPMRTLGETRLWYSFFLSIIGYFIYKRWKYSYFLSYSIFLAALFLFLNYIKPEIHNKTLMPSLQSIYFIPHVIVYMIAYAFLAASSLIGFRGLIDKYRNKYKEKTLNLADNIVYIGFGFLTLGIIFGALWAKEAWGHYWTWDPKETWALLTWMVYLIYIHFRYNKPKSHKTHLSVLTLAFIILLICWLGISYLPSAQSSVHVYQG